MSPLRWREPLHEQRVSVVGREYMVSEVSNGPEKNDLAEGAPESLATLAGCRK